LVDFSPGALICKVDAPERTSAIGQSWFGSAVLSATLACAWASDEPKNRLFMRARNDEPPEADGAGAESMLLDEHPANVATSRIAVLAWPRPHTPLPQPFIALDR